MNTRKNNLSSGIYNLWLQISNRRKIQLSILFIFILLSSVAELVSLGAVFPFLSILTTPEIAFKSTYFNRILNLLDINSQSEILLLLTCLFCITILLSSTIRILVLWGQTKLSYAIGADLSISIYKKTLYQPYSVHVSRNSSDLISIISNKVNSVISNIIIAFLVNVSSFILMIMIVIGLIFINPLNAFITFGLFGFIYLVLIVSTRRYVLYNGEKINKESTRIIKALQEGLGGIRDILLDGTQQIYCNEYQKADLPLRKSQANLTIIGGIPRYILEAFGMVLIALLAYLISARSGGFVKEIPALGALVLGAQRLLPIMQMIYGNLAAMNGAKATLADVLQMLDQEMPLINQLDNEKQIPFNSKIELKGICFSYSNSSIKIIDNVTFSILKGDKIGLIGTTGSGKSTLIDILMGLLTPDSGEIYIDNTLVNKENNHNWQRNIAHVPQTIFLTDTTIAENIAFGIEYKNINLELLYKVSEQAQIGGIINTWEDKYSTIVGERGVRLSGGQRQRIGIARALYKCANIIIFDEATSALDNETEQEVMNSIFNLTPDMTVLIVAHRLSTLQKCNKIIELKDGKINRIGSYSEIILSMKNNSV